MLPKPIQNGNMTKAWATTAEALKFVPKAEALLLLKVTNDACIGQDDSNWNIIIKTITRYLYTEG